VNFVRVVTTRIALDHLSVKFPEESGIVLIVFQKNHKNVLFAKATLNKPGIVNRQIICLLGEIFCFICQITFSPIMFNNTNSINKDNSNKIKFIFTLTYLKCLQ